MFFFRNTILKFHLVNVVITIFHQTTFVDFIVTHHLVSVCATTNLLCFTPTKTNELVTPTINLRSVSRTVIHQKCCLWPNSLRDKIESCQLSMYLKYANNKEQ